MSLELQAPRGVRLRALRPNDFEFARALYLESSRPLLSAIACWDEDGVIARFTNAFKSKAARVICVGKTDIGWLQVSAAPDAIHLHQIHLIARFRNRGIGSGLLQNIMIHATERGVPVTLNVIPGNAAIELYLRLGFRTVAEEKDLLRMRWDSTHPDNR